MIYSTEYVGEALRPLWDTRFQESDPSAHLRHTGEAHHRKAFYASINNNR